MRNSSLRSIGLSSGLVLLASWGVAQPIPIYSSGFLHSPLGGLSSMTEQSTGNGGRKLTACCLGSSGQDGVEIRVASQWGGAVGVDYTAAEAFGSELTITPLGIDGLPRAIIEVAGLGDGIGTVITTTTFPGATAIRTVEFDAQGVVISDTTTFGDTLDHLIPPTNCPPPLQPTVWYTSYGQVVWSCGPKRNLKGDPYPYLRVASPVGTPLSLEVDVIQVTGRNTGDFDVYDAAVGTFGVESQGLGQSIVSEPCASVYPCPPDEVVLLAENIGLSGDDGLAMFLESDDGGRVAVNASHLLTTGGEVTMVFGNPIGGLTIPRCGRCDKRVIMTGFGDGMGGGMTTFDFNEPNAIAVRLIAFDDLGEVISDEVHPGPVVHRPWVPNFTCPDGSKPIIIVGWIHFPGFPEPMMWIGWACNNGGIYTYEPGQHRIAAAPIHPSGLTLSPAVHVVAVTGRNVPTIEVTGVSFEVRCAADTDGDGAVTLADLLAVLGNFGQTGVGRAQGDVTDDGTVGLEDLLAVLGGFGSACR